jgi:hypothetical protein
MLPVNVGTFAEAWNRPNPLTHGISRTGLGFPGMGSTPLPFVGLCLGLCSLRSLFTPPTQAILAMVLGDYAGFGGFSFVAFVF